MRVRDFTEVFSRIPFLKTCSPDDFEIKPLPGLTNFNFRLSNANLDYVLRIPRAQTNHIINRRNEAFNVDRAIQLGLAPNLLWRDDSGLSLTGCIKGAKTLTTGQLQNGDLLPLLVDRLSLLHNATLTFKGRIDLPALLRRYFNLMSVDQNMKLNACYKKALAIHQAIETKDLRIVPSHNDLVLENLLMDHCGQLWMIDWEYSAMTSPYWDLATICNAGRLNPIQSRQLLERYNRQVTELKFGCLRRFQYMLQVLTLSWLLVFSPQGFEKEYSWLKKLEA